MKAIKLKVENVYDVLFSYPPLHASVLSNWKKLLSDSMTSLTTERGTVSFDLSSGKL